MFITVVLATYNGEKYIEGQLLSILNQSISPNEVLIFDDRSSDSTVLKINRFIKDNNLNNWILNVNEKNLGWKRNFINGISLASGDICFISDQDDLWHEKKIECMVNVFEKEKKANLVVSNFRKFTHEAEVIERASNVTSNYNKLNDSLKNWQIPYPGCTFAVRMEFFNKIKQFWEDSIPHDFLIFEAAWLTDSIYVCDECLHFFRRHQESVTTGSPALLEKNKRINELNEIAYMISNLMNSDDIFKSKKGTELVEWLRSRSLFIKNRSLRDLLKMIGSIRYYKKVRTFLTDCFVAFK